MFYWYGGRASGEGVICNKNRFLTILLKEEYVFLLFYR